MERILNESMVESYLNYLKSEERAPSTLQKYLQELHAFLAFIRGREITKEQVMAYKADMTKQRAPSSVNGALCAVNGLLSWLGWHDCRVKALRVQQSVYRDGRRELTKAEYYRLLAAAKQNHNERLYGLLQTICSTGIRVSELCFITAEALCVGQVQIYNKGKSRVILLPKALCEYLKKYCNKRSIKQGAIFVTRTGKPLSRNNIWAMMKTLCRTAHVAREKVFPHNLRHLFAREFYRQEHDLEHLASLLGHSSINTTRIYTQSTGREHQRQIERMHLII